MVSGGLYPSFKHLANWELVSYALTDEEAVNLTCIDMSCGIWAPNLTYDNGTFYLAYTIVYTDRSKFKDINKYPLSLALRMSLDIGVNVAWNQVLAMALVSVIPLIPLFFMAQKYFVEGIATTGLKS